MRHAPPLCLAGASLLVPSVILLETGLGHHIRQVLLREIPQKTRHFHATLLDRFLLELVVVVYAHSVAAMRAFVFLCAQSGTAARRSPQRVALVHVLLSIVLNLHEHGDHVRQPLTRHLCAQLPSFLGSLSEQPPHAVHVLVVAPCVLLNSPVLEYRWPEESFVVDSVLINLISPRPDLHPLVVHVEAENVKHFQFTLPSFPGVVVGESDTKHLAFLIALVRIVLSPINVTRAL
mmetsp:Transcript_4439/g.10692  ORF Transcript_4439/g.10692 Transcript_4439/m.10692 type:complete len:234 (-) Transcript_4439:530-1231(-)